MHWFIEALRCIVYKYIFTCNYKLLETNIICSGCDKTNCIVLFY